VIKWCNAEVKYQLNQGVSEVNDRVITSGSRPAIQEIPETRQKFINKTYFHLLGAILFLVAIEAFLFKSGYAESIARALTGVNWLIVLGAFMVVGWMASHVAHTKMSIGAQYASLGGFVIAKAIILVPMLYMAMQINPGIIESAATVTLLGFGVLTAIVFFTGKDFSFLRSLLFWIGGAALIAIIASVLFGMHLGTWFSVGMVAFAGAAVLYDTSNVFKHYSEDRYVAAALELFSSVSLMFWYVLRIFLSQE